MTVRQHLDTIGLLWIVYGALWLAGGLLMVLLFGLGGVGMGIAGLSGGEDELLIAGGGYLVVAVVAGLFFVLFAAPHIVVGIAVRRRRKWSRIGAIVLGAIALTNMPLGTLLGVYTIYKLVDPEVRAELEGPTG
jgi:hypothetical protein